jgi:transcriptional regulator with GAF, ATPase, and Fis domain
MMTMDQMIRHHIQQALLQCDYQIHGSGGAAELLGVNPNTLRSKMSKLSISFKSA